MLQDLKLKFYQLMIEVARHDGSYLDICKYYRAMFDTPSVLEDKEKKHEVIPWKIIALLLVNVVVLQGAEQNSVHWLPPTVLSQAATQLSCSLEEMAFSPISAT